jgi:regulator of protease activity HflC (stomatin/prohibitin superfamily)
MEKIVKPTSGFVALLFAVLFIAAGFFCLVRLEDGGWMLAGALTSFFISILLLKGLMIVNPHHARVLNFFGKYAGTVKDNGIFFVNPFFLTHKVSLRMENLQGQTLKVNDKMGNPIEIGAVVVWQVGDTFKSTYEVENYDEYVKVQSEAAVRHLANSFSYDSLEDEHADITLRGGGDKVNEILEDELTARLAPAGIIVREARISHLAYAPEIAGAMLQRQQATAIVAARTKIVEGAVGMVDMALEMLSRKNIVELDEEKKAAMVSNLMVVLCGERSAQPVLNAGTLYQ